MRRSLLFWALAAAIAAGCGGKVVVDSGTLTGGSGGGSSSSSSSGAPAKSCGGPVGGLCAAGEYCKYNPAGTCAICRHRRVHGGARGRVPADCPAVCGCDGHFYCTACQAHQAGVDVDSQGYCPVDAGGADVEYGAYMMPTNVPRYVITKTEHGANRCTMLVMSILSGPLPDIQVTMGWYAERALVTPSAADCAVSPGGFPNIAPAQSVDADAGKGSVKQDNLSFPCSVSVGVTLAFPQVAGWVPATEDLVVDGLYLQNVPCGG